MAEKKVLVAMSGGVDSSVAALLLLRQGFTVAGATFRLFEGEASSTAAKTVCEALGIPHYMLDYRELFEKYVLANFAEEYRRGRTPNPCVRCNRHIKFPAFLQSARELGYTHIATGHYARVEWDANAGQYRLRKGARESKDQSYVMYNLTQELLASILFPLGEYAKEDVRALARESNLACADNPESQDICFIPDGNYHAFLERYTGETGEPGNFVDAAGNILGRHHGVWRYTVGQRKGLGISFGKPVYVSAIDIAANTVTLTEDAALFFGSLYARDMQYLSGFIPNEPFAATVRIRYAHRGAPATVYPLEEGRCAHIVFEQPQRAITNGQSAVLYEGEYLLGGGVISEAS